MPCVSGEGAECIIIQASRERRALEAGVEVNSRAMTSTFACTPSVDSLLHGTARGHYSPLQRLAE